MKIYYEKGNVVEQGTFWGISTGQRYDVKQATELLENSIKAHTALVLGLAPMIGLVFAVFLPAIGIAMAVKFVGEKIWENLRTLSVQSFSLGWRPLESYLAGRKKKK